MVVDENEAVVVGTEDVLSVLGVVCLALVVVLVALVVVLVAFALEDPAVSSSPASLQVRVGQGLLLVWTTFPVDVGKLELVLSLEKRIVPAAEEVEQTDVVVGSALAAELE